MWEVETGKHVGDVEKLFPGLYAEIRETGKDRPPGI